MPSSRFAGFVIVSRYKLSAGYCCFNLLFHRLLGIGAVMCCGSLMIAPCKINHFSKVIEKHYITIPVVS